MSFTVENNTIMCGVVSYFETVSKMKRKKEKVKIQWRHIHTLLRGHVQGNLKLDLSRPLFKGASISIPNNSVAPILQSIEVFCLALICSCLTTGGWVIEKIKKNVYQQNLCVKTLFYLSHSTWQFFLFIVELDSVEHY